jgi:dihydrofolate reductase
MMGKVVLYIAASLDSYIATEDGGIAWLDTFQVPNEDYGYSAFMANVGAVIMGGKTYRQVLTFGEWAYKGAVTYIVTSQPLADHPHDDVRKVAGDFAGLVQRIKAETDKDIFFVGGAQLTKAFVELDLIDQYEIALMPVMLGKGIPLFLELETVQKVTLTGTKTYPNGVVALTYQVNHQ